MDTGRPLTAGEIALAESIYGSMIDYSDVTVYNKSFAPLMRISAPNGNVYYSKGYSEKRALYADDISKLGYEAQATLIHELFHVYQHQQGTRVLFERLGDTLGSVAQIA